jgi:hypothetical protein
VSTTTDLIAGMAADLDAAGIGTYRASGIYTTGEVGITVCAVPPVPDDLIALTPYPVDDTTAAPYEGACSVLLGVQVRLRAGTDPRSILDRAEAVYGRWHMREGAVFGGVPVGLLWRASQAWMGADSNNRQELSANYYARVDWPAPTD